ncbi:MAG: hypothetical protein HY431_02070 [Candidatus Levybacteria bacterium]|nr:hypothetical protein [Candidatus Levybacteria bacterium]
MGKITIEGTVLDIDSLDFTAGGTITTGGTGDLTLTPAGGNILSSSPLNIGGGIAAAYNYFGDAAGTPTVAASDDDLYIEDDLEIGDSATISGTLTLGGTSGIIRPATGDLSLQYKSGANAWTTAMTIDDVTGNVGIGTTSPSGRLSVSGGWLTLEDGQAFSWNDSQSSTYITNGYAGAINLETSDGRMAFYTAPSGTAGGAVTVTERLTIVNTGNVGIGTTSPLATLDVRTNSGTLPVASISGATSFASLVVDNSGVGDIFTASSSGLNRFVITQQGNVGIGTTTPVAADSLAKTFQIGDRSIFQSTVGTQTTIANNAYYDGAWKYAVSGVASAMRLNGLGGTGGDITFTTAASGTAGNTITNWDTSNIRMTILNGGNVGIGTTAPEARAQVTGGGLCVGSDANCNTDNNTEGTVYAATTAMTVYDVAENYPTKVTDLVPGEVVSMDPARGVFVVRSQQPYDPKAIGAVSAEPGVLLGGFNGKQFKDERQVAVALSGRITVKASNENGPINQGDFVTSSGAPGKVMKATRAGPVIGQALENWDQSKDSVMVFIKATYYDPDVQLAGDGNLTIEPSVDYGFVVKRNGEVFTRIGGFSEIVSAKIRAGLIEAEQSTVYSLQSSVASISELSANSLAVATDNITIGTQTLRDYIASVVEQVLSQSLVASRQSPELQANIISPLSNEQDGKIAVKLNDNEGKSKLEIKNASDSAVAVIDSQGNASFSGKLRSQQLEVSSDASVSGVLRASQVIADDLILSEEALAKLSGQIASVSSTSNAPPATSSAFASDPNATQSATSNQQLATSGYWLEASASATIQNLTVTQGLMSFGPTSLFEASVADRLFIGSQLSLANNSINVLGSNLEIQPLKQGGVSFLSGLVEIDTDGNLKVDGNAYFAKDVTIEGRLFANIIAPIPGKDIVFDLASGSSQLATSSAKFEIRNSTGSALFSVNSEGDIVSSGSASIGKLNLDFVPEALALSPTQVLATGSAGTAFVKANNYEVTVLNELVTENSLIYITPVGENIGGQVYLLRQTPENQTLPGVQGSFTVGINQPVTTDAKFNFLIIN